MKIRIRQRPVVESHPAAVSLAPLSLTLRSRPKRVLDFDIENRPLSYLGSDFTTAEVTAIAWAWTDNPDDVTVYLLGETPLSSILDAFVRAYNAADMVSGHFVKSHDLPMINGALMELGMAPLGEKLVQDTKTDLMVLKGISKSQESLGAMLNLSSPKVQMNQTKWRAANRLTPEGLAEVRERVRGDVQQHIELRQRLLDLGYLGPPKTWRPGSTRAEAYAP